MEVATTTAKERLAQIYKNLKHKGETLGFLGESGFIAWALENGYEYGKKIVRIDQEKPYYPENCFWRKSALHPATVRIYENRAAEWDEFVIPLRASLKYALEEYERRQEEQKQATAHHRNTHWCYEHPDLVREGIVWTG